MTRHIKLSSAGIPTLPNSFFSSKRDIISMIVGRMAVSCPNPNFPTIAIPVTTTTTVTIILAKADGVIPANVRIAPIQNPQSQPARGSVPYTRRPLTMMQPKILRRCSSPFVTDPQVLVHRKTQMQDLLQNLGTCHTTDQGQIKFQKTQVCLG